METKLDELNDTLDKMVHVLSSLTAPQAVGKDRQVRSLYAPAAIAVLVLTQIAYAQVSISILGAQSPTDTIKVGRTSAATRLVAEA